MFASNLDGQRWAGLVAVNLKVEEVGRFAAVPVAASVNEEFDLPVRRWLLFCMPPPCRDV